jgi:hypothetical protein
MEPLNDFPNFTKFKNIILVADLDRKDLAAQITRRLLPQQNYPSPKE